LHDSEQRRERELSQLLPYHFTAELALPYELCLFAVAALGQHGHSQ
jgi:hypothetical protein